jgi:hypothetical protein
MRLQVVLVTSSVRRAESYSPDKANPDIRITKKAPRKGSTSKPTTERNLVLLRTIQNDLESLINRGIRYRSTRVLTTAGVRIRI